MKIIWSYIIGDVSFVIYQNQPQIFADNPDQN